MVESAAALRAAPPFDVLPAHVIWSLAQASRTVEYAAGELILDAFRDKPDDVCVVLTGLVDLWVDAERVHSPDGNNAAPDVRAGPGEVFGLDATITGKAIGPMAAAAGETCVLRIPAGLTERALAATHGAPRVTAREHPPAAWADTPRHLQVDELVVTEPLVVPGHLSVREVAAAMTRGFAVVDVHDGLQGIVTDRTLRERVLARGLAPGTPVHVAAATDLPRLRSGASASEALILLLDTQADYVLVTDAVDRVLGAVDPRDFIGSSVTAGVVLHERIRRSESVGQLQQQALRMPELLADLLARGLASARVLSIYSALVEAVVRRMLELVLADRPDLSPDAFTWLSLGSNGRREATLSSDLDCAAAFHNAPSQEEIDLYRTAFYEVTQRLAEAGLTSDSHGATAAHKLFARTCHSWGSSARAWLSDPDEDDAVMMTSLLLDARPIHGENCLSEVTETFASLHNRPGTMRMLLEESLAKRPRRPGRRLLPGRRHRFDVKKHALLPIVNLARWAGLSVGSTALATTDRLRAAAGSSILPEHQSATLIEVFEVLQAIRLRHQLRQVQSGEAPTDRLDLDAVSVIDRSIMIRAVREIAAVQQRMANVSRFEPPEEWSRPEPTEARRRRT